jgi:hypothetical protein
MDGTPKTRKRLTLAEVQNLLDRDEGDTGWLCPAHDDTSPSLTVNEEDKGIVLKCHAGCTFEQVCEALDVELWQLFTAAREEDDNNSGPQSLAFDGCTLAQYAQGKGLDLEMLQIWGLTERHTERQSDGKPVVLIPYVDQHGKEVATRVRLSLKPNQLRFKWSRQGTKAPLYGVWRINEFLQEGCTSIFLVEGESDCHTLWQHGWPAVGIPGAGIWRDEWADYLEEFDSLYVVIEPDNGGHALKSHMVESRLKERVHFIYMSADAKDMNELQRNARECGEDFDELLAELMEGSVPAMEDEGADADADREAVRQEAWSKCEALAKEPDILVCFAEAIEQRGVVGERKAAKLLYLVMTTRVLPELVSAIVHGTSSTGKSWLMENVFKFFPEAAVYVVTTISDSVIVRSTEPMQHRFLVFLEADGISENVEHVLRTLVSEGYIKADIAVPSEDKGWEVKTFLREGPTGLLMTTTRLWMNKENETRVLKIPTNDSPTQTQQIMDEVVSRYLPGGR